VNEFLVLLILLVFSGLFSGSETALVALSKGRVEALLKEGRGGAQALFQLKRDPSRMLITILIGNNLANIAASSIATVIATEWFGRFGPSIAVAVLTVVILIFGEITPKSLATRYAERISLAIAPFMFGFMRLITPLVWVFGEFMIWIHRITGVKSDPTVTESELVRLAWHGEEEGIIDHNEREIIERVFEFNDLEVRDVMTPRNQVFALEGNQTIAEVLPQIKGVNFSRIPIFNQRPDEIHWVAYKREILEAAAYRKSEIRLNEIAHEPLFVPQNQPIDELLANLRSKKRHLAIVVDEYGIVQGIVTLEDLLEELVGEIYDENDEIREGLSKLSKNKISVDGTLELRVVEDFFEIELSGKPTDSVSLWILGHMERLPAQGEQFDLEGLSVTVARATSRRILQVIIQGPANTPAQPEGQQPNPK
jgi:magnesium and cobalt exporter, CNNM family